MSITVYTYGSGDFALYGVDSGQTTMAANYANAYAAIQVDTWANGPYALQPAGIFLQPWWTGDGHLLKKASNGHLVKNAGGRLVKRFPYYDDASGAQCIAIADLCEISAGDKGTVVTSVKVNLTTIFQNVLNLPSGSESWVGHIAFYTTALITPNDWAWLDGFPGVEFQISSSQGATDVTFSDINGSVTLDNWFWVVYGLAKAQYATMPTYDVSNLTYKGTLPGGEKMWSKDVKVQFGLSNTYVLNP
jgi:hypothetical protein